MNAALMSSQCLRLLQSGDSKSIAHLDFWIRSLVENVFPEMGQIVGAKKTPEYFSVIGENLAQLMMSDLLTAATVNKLTNKMIYRDMASFPVPQVVTDSALSDFSRVWKRLYISTFSHDERECMFLLIHRKLPTPERLHRIGVRNNPSCSVCPNQVVADLTHLFCSCVRTAPVWSWLKQKIVKFGGTRQLSDTELLTFTFPKLNHDGIVSWLLGMYVSYVWHHQNEVKLCQSKFFGYLTFKYKKNKSQLGVIKEFE